MMQRTLLLALMTVTIPGGCVKSGSAPVQEETPWADTNGKTQVRLAIADELIESGLLGQGLVILSQLRSEGIDEPGLDVLQARCLMLQGVHSEAITHVMQKPSSFLFNFNLNFGSHFGLQMEPNFVKNHLSPTLKQFC